MTRTEAIAHLLTLPESATVFLIAVTPDAIVDRLRAEYPVTYGRAGRERALSEAENAIGGYPAPTFNDEVGIANDIVSHVADALYSTRERV